MCHLLLSSDWPNNNMIGGVLVVLLVSVLTTRYIPLLLTDKNMIPIQLYNVIIYMKHYTYDIYVYITLQKNSMVMII